MAKKSTGVTISYLIYGQSLNTGKNNHKSLGNVMWMLSFHFYLMILTV